MRRRAWVGLAVVTAVAGPQAAQAARTVGYQGYTSQGHEIAFKRSSGGVLGMRIVVRANCADEQGQNHGDYDFSLRAVDRLADRVRRGAFTVKLDGAGKTPDAVIKGRLNRRGVARGTISANGRVTRPAELGTCRSGTVRWTAGP